MLGHLVQQLTQSVASARHVWDRACAPPAEPAGIHNRLVPYGSYGTRLPGQMMWFLPTLWQAHRGQEAPGGGSPTPAGVVNTADRGFWWSVDMWFREISHPWGGPVTDSGDLVRATERRADAAQDRPSAGCCCGVTLTKRGHTRPPISTDAQGGGFVGGVARRRGWRFVDTRPGGGRACHNGGF
eukprot:scaffold4399_cov115-Isochrysis_galbana.AAC.1